MNLKNLIKKERCLMLNSFTKTEALYELIEIVENEGFSADSEALKKDIFYREQIMSTGIGQGIGIPHVRFEGVNEPIVLVGINPKGLDKYISMDDEVVKIVVMIIVGGDQHREYLRILSLIIRKLKDLNVRNSLLNCVDNEEICNVFTKDVV